jgi:hypothetical protein
MTRKTDGSENLNAATGTRPSAAWARDKRYANRSVRPNSSVQPEGQARGARDCYLGREESRAA